MRESKFRAWDKNKKKFEFFELVSSHSILTTLPIPSEGKWEHLKEFEQYTGLKDENGVEIYESDIVKNTYCSYIVVWENRMARFHLQIIYKDQCKGIRQTHEDMPLDANDIWVKGNIHENRESLDS